MDSILEVAILAGTISSGIAFVLTPVVIRIAKKIGIVDDPRLKTHPKVIHTYPVPRGGGIAIFAALLVSSLIFLDIDKHLLGILLGGLFIVFIGIIDDKYDLNPYLRLFMQFVAAAIPIASGIGISFITNPISGGIIDLSHPRISFDVFGEIRTIWILSDIFALFWIVTLMNFLNMGAKGIDGQLPGVVSIAALTIAVLSLKFSADITQWPVIALAAITSGAYLGFLPWNLYPQKIMPSFSGSVLAGYLLAILAILSTAKVGTLVVALGVPIIDTGYTIARRIISGKSPVWGDTGHLHHRLLNAGLTKRQIALFYWLTTAFLGILALNLKSTFKLYTIVGTAAFVGGLILWLTYRKSPRS